VGKKVHFSQSLSAFVELPEGIMSGTNASLQSFHVPKSGINTLLCNKYTIYCLPRQNDQYMQNQCKYRYSLIIPQPFALS